MKMKTKTMKRGANVTELKVAQNEKSFIFIS